MESEFEIPGRGSDYCIILVYKPRLLALLFSPVICVFRKQRCLTCHHYCGFSVPLYFQYWLSKKISGRVFQTLVCFLQFLSAVVTQGRKQPYTCSGSFLKCITKQQIILVHLRSILLKPERHCTGDEHVVKGSWWIQSKVNELLYRELLFSKQIGVMLFFSDAANFCWRQLGKKNRFTLLL